MDNLNSQFRGYMTCGQSRTSATVHFNCLLPRMNLFFGPMRHMMIANLVMASPSARELLARKVAKANAGRLPTELTDSVGVFKSYLHGLNAIDGLIGICHPNGYVVDFETGLLFDSVEIGRRIAQLVHEHFYGSMEFSFEVDPGYQAAAAQRLSSGAILPRGSGLLLDDAPF